MMRREMRLQQSWWNEMGQRITDGEVLPAEIISGLSSSINMLHALDDEYEAIKNEMSGLEELLAHCEQIIDAL
jgi:hypothetical protein